MTFFSFLRLPLLFSILILNTTSTTAQSFSGFGGSIKDNASRNQFTASVSGLASSIDTNFGLFGVTLNITHPYVSDLNIFLISPDNTLIELSTGNGGSGKNYTNCFLTNSSSNKITGGVAPFKGNHKPEGSLGVMNNKQNPNGTWKLVIVDTKPKQDSGTLVSWNLVFNTKPCKLEPFVNSNLPLILINTYGKAIPDEPKIWATMRIVNNVSSPNAVSDSGKFFNHGIAIETRGSTSQSFPKKPYGFSTVLKNMSDTNVSLLGLPSEHDWVLNATYNDKSLMRDVLAYELARRTGRYATRYRYCELFINGNYQGIYILMEKVKRDKNRVDITKLEPKDSTGNALTGGYIVKIDKTTGNNSGGWIDTFPIAPGSSGRVYFQYDYPNGDDMVKKQKDYIANAIYKFEVALASSTFTNPTTGYRKYADENTFIDLSIINEISKNVDGYRLSTYLFKDRDSKNGKIKMGPVWDFNLAFNNADYNNSSDPVGWEFDISDGCPFWWKRLWEDSNYVKSYYCRWNELRQSVLSLYNINKFLDSTYQVLEEASYRNFQRWPVMGIYIWPNPSPLSYSMREEVDSLKSWIEKRVKWIDATLAANCKNTQTCSAKVAVFSDKKSVCKYQTVTLYADGVGNSFKWTPSQGMNISDGRKVIAKLDTTTRYKVIMQTAKGCTDSAFITIKTLPLPGTTISGITSFCQGSSTLLSAPMGYKKYQWSPSMGLNTTSEYQVKASHRYTLTYKMVVTDSLGCSDSNYVTATTYAKPELTISAARDSVCGGDSTMLTVKGANTYKWFPSEGLTDSAGNTVIVYPKNTIYTVTGKSDKGCMDTTSYSVYNYTRAPFSIETSKSQFCYGQGTTLGVKKGSGSDLNWRSTTGFGGSNADIISVYPKSDTRYYVNGLDKNGCEDSAYIDIIVYPEMNVKIDGNSVICKGEKTTLKASGAEVYKWSPATGISSTSGEEVIASPVNNIQYRVIGTSSNSCNDTAVIDIKVNPLPVLKITASALEIEEGNTDTLRVSGAQKYLWTPANSLNTDTGNMVIASPLINTTYRVSATDINLCNANDSILVKVTKKQINYINSLNRINYNLYPNPAHSVLYLQLKNVISANLTLAIYNLPGEKILEQPIRKMFTDLDINGLLPGIYLVKLSDKNNNTEVKKIIIQ